MPSIPRPKHNREAIGARLRFEILRRCNFACYYCGVPAAMGLKQLHIDHVIPVALGGTNDMWNLVAACWDCNAGKTNTVPPADLVKAVRDDCYLAHEKDIRLDQCEYCRLPIALVADEEATGQCQTCNELMVDSFEHGVYVGRRGDR